MKKAHKLLHIINEVAKDIPYKPKEVKVRRAPKDIGKPLSVIKPKSDVSGTYKKDIPVSYDSGSVKSELAGFDVPGREERSPAEEYKRYALERKLLVIQELEKAVKTMNRTKFFYADLGNLSDEELDLIATGASSGLPHEKELIQQAKEEISHR